MSAPPIDVCAHRGLVHMIAKRYAFAVRGDRGITYDDLVQAGFVGAMRGAESYDPAVASWSTYATWWIRQAVQREIANRGETVRVPVGEQAKRRKRGEWARANVHSLDARIAGDEDGRSYLDMLASPEPEDAPDLPPLEELIARTPALTERQRRVLRLRASDAELTLEQVGAELGVSRERARQIEAKAVLAIREQLVRDGDLKRVEVPRYVASQREVAARRRRERLQDPAYREAENDRQRRMRAARKVAA